MFIYLVYSKLVILVFRNKIWELYSWSVLCYVYLAVWNLLYSRLTEADGCQTREVEAGRFSQQGRAKQPQQHPHSG